MKKYGNVTISILGCRIVSSMYPEVKSTGIRHIAPFQKWMRIRIKEAEKAETEYSTGKMWIEVPF